MTTTSTALRERSLLAIAAGIILLVGLPRPARSGEATAFGDRTLLSTPSNFADLSLLIAPEYPCGWPTFPQYQINHYLRIGPASPYNGDIVALEGNTGTQLDVPAHSVAPLGSGLKNAGEFGGMTIDKVPIWQHVGEACVIDCRDLLDRAPNGRSPLITRDRVIAWEKAHRALGPGDVVLFRSGYTDRHYKPWPEGRRFAADPLEGTAPAWPDPDVPCMEYLVSRKVTTLGTDSTSMGPLPPELAEPTHFAGLKHGMIWTESATGLGALPATGAFYGMIGPKHARGIYGEGRAFAVVEPALAARLIASARRQDVADLSVVLADDLPATWPGRGVARHRHPYITVRFGKNGNTNTPFEAHLTDSHAGTHLVPPSFALPKPGFDDASYAPEVRNWLREYEQAHGPRGTSTVTAEQVPLDQTSGTLRIIDVRRKIGLIDKSRWPASPEVTPADVEADEATHGPIRPGDVVVFRTDWTDRFYRPLPTGEACMLDPINGKSEGWPAPNASTVALLARRGVRCVATDAPTIGGVDPRNALMTYWALGSKGMVAVEFLTGLGALPADKEVYFLFAGVKIRGAHGAPGRAIALY